MAFEPIDIGGNPRLIPEGLFSGFAKSAPSDPFKILDDESFPFDDILGSLEPRAALSQVNLHFGTGNEDINGKQAKSFLPGRGAFNGNDYSF